MQENGTRDEVDDVDGFVRGTILKTSSCVDNKLYRVSWAVTRTTAPESLALGFCHENCAVWLSNDADAGAWTRL